MRLQPKDTFGVQDDIEILASLEVVRSVNNGITIDATKVTAAPNGDKIIRKGMPLAKITNGKFRPYTGTKVKTGAAASDTVIELEDASRLVVGDEVKIGNETKTITAIDYAENKITVSALSAAAPSGTVVETTDGGGNPSVILNRTVNVKDGDHVVGGYEVAKVIAARIPVTVDDTLRQKMPHIVFA